MPVFITINVHERTSCTGRSGTTCVEVTSTNPVYRCEELEGSIYDDIDENRFDDLKDETAERYDSHCQPPQLPSPRPNSQDDNQDHGYENLNEENADHVYLCILNDDEAEGCVQDAKAQDGDKDTKPSEQD